MYLRFMCSNLIFVCFDRGQTSGAKCKLTFYMKIACFYIKKTILLCYKKKSVLVFSKFISKSAFRLKLAVYPVCTGYVFKMGSHQRTYLPIR